MPRPVQSGAAALSLARSYGLKGKVGLQLDEIIVPVHIIGTALEDEGTKAAGTGLSDPGVGQFANVGLHNPADSGVLLITEWIASSPAAGAARRLIARSINDATAFASDDPGTLLDDRKAGLGIPEKHPTGRIVTASSAGEFPLGAIRVLTEAGGSGSVKSALADPITLPLVISPGNTIWFGGDTADTNLRANFVWTEFPFLAEHRGRP